MIEFKIITCPDRSQQATYQHVGSTITIGRSEGDMIVNDPQLAPSQFRVQVDPNKSTIENLSEEVELRLNGKPINASMPLKEKDNITVGRTTFNFTKLNNLPLQAPDRYEIPSAKERFADGTKEKAILDVLEQLEKSLGGSNAGTGISAGPKPGGPPPIPSRSK